MLNLSRESCLEALRTISLLSQKWSFAHRAAFSKVGSFLPFAALWLRVRSDLPLVHFAITPPRLSPYAPACPPAHTLSHSWQRLCCCCALGWPGIWPQDSRCCAACPSCTGAGRCRPNQLVKGVGSLPNLRKSLTHHLWVIP